MIEVDIAGNFLLFTKSFWFDLIPGFLFHGKKRGKVCGGFQKYSTAK